MTEKQKAAAFKKVNKKVAVGFYDELVDVVPLPTKEELRKLMYEAVAAKVSKIFENNNFTVEKILENYIRNIFMVAIGLRTDWGRIELANNSASENSVLSQGLRKHVAEGVTRLFDNMSIDTVFSQKEKDALINELKSKYKSEVRYKLGNDLRDAAAKKASEEADKMISDILSDFDIRDGDEL